MFLSCMTQLYIPSSASVALIIDMAETLPDLLHLTMVLGMIDVQESWTLSPFIPYCFGGALNTLLGSAYGEREECHSVANPLPVKVV